MRKIILNSDQKSKIEELYSVGGSRKTISKQLNISEHAVKQLIATFPERPYKYIGKRFGRLIVLSKLGTHKNGCPIVECRCDCGNLTKVIVSNLTSSSSLTVSCGCYNRDKSVSNNPWPQELKQYIAQETANRGNNFSLTLEEFKNLCSSNCSYCGIEPCGKMRSGREKRNGIDRINNSIGYELSNCVPCCWICNRMKGKMPQQEFLLHIKKVYRNKIIPI
jgi:hypothetical protein